MNALGNRTIKKERKRYSLMVKIPPKLPVFVCFVVSAGRRESISRLEEIAAGVDDDSARNASGPKR